MEAATVDLKIGRWFIRLLYFRRLQNLRFREPETELEIVPQRRHQLAGRGSRRSRGYPAEVGAIDTHVRIRENRVV